MSKKPHKDASKSQRQFPDQSKKDAGPDASSLDIRVRELEAELKRVERERDILKKALSILSQSD